jgi:hypothetical protein
MTKTDLKPIWKPIGLEWARKPAWPGPNPAWLVFTGPNSLAAAELAWLVLLWIQGRKYSENHIYFIRTTN